MTLRESIRVLVHEIINNDLREKIKKILIEELSNSKDPSSLAERRSEAAKKAARTRAANKISKKK